MWCPSVSLSVWANAWLAGHAAPDDVLDALSLWAPKHSVTAYDAVAAGRTGLPWPDVYDGGAMSMLQTVRTAAGPRSAGPRLPAIGVLLPVPGDVRGLAPGTQFQRDALDVGEAVVVSTPGGESIGAVPVFEYDGDFDDEGDGSVDPADVTLSWSVYSIPAVPPIEQSDLGEAEYSLRSAIRTATEALSSLQLADTGGADPRALVEEVLQAGSLHGVPDHAPARAVRVLSTAAHIDAVITVSTGPVPISTHSASAAHIADTALRPLSSVVRSARVAAVSAILHSAWQ